MSQDRDEVRNLIRDEVIRAGPIEEARGALELIVESSLRWTRNDSGLVVTVVSQTGEPRFILRDGHDTAMSVRDLVSELRVQHPGLFRAGPAPGNAQESAGVPGRRDEAQAGEGDAAAPSPPSEQEIPRAAPKPADRDIWHVGSDGIGDESDDEDDGDGPSLAERGRRLASDAIPRLPILRGATRDRIVAPARPSEQHHPDARSAAGDLPTGSAEPAKVFEENAPRKWRRPGLVLPATALVLLVAAGLIAIPFVSTRDETPPAVETATRAAPEAPGPKEQQPPDTAPDAPPAGKAADAQPVEEGTIRGVPQVLDTAALFLDGRAVRLFGVQWAKGAGTPEQFAQYLAGREVSCTPAGSADVYNCTLEGRDLSTVVLYNGGGRTTAEATPDLKRAEEHAKRMRVGVWSEQGTVQPTRQ
jgi:endonuclease YncB( thermonuclease family)